MYYNALFMKNIILLQTLCITLTVSAQMSDPVPVKTATNTQLKAELELIYDSDQDIRNQYRIAQKANGFDNPEVYNLGLEINKTDSINTEKVIKILDAHGWVGKSIVGSKGSQALFLVIQHANLQTQNKYLPMMRDAAKNNEASLSSLALLEDRIALREGRHQIYGSQIAAHPVSNEMYVLPLHDPDNVDERRAKMKLGPLKEYVANWKIVWDAESYKNQLPEYEKILKEKKIN